jgi:hypothetical protein
MVDIPQKQIVCLLEDESVVCLVGDGDVEAIAVVNDDHGIPRLVFCSLGENSKFGVESYGN